MTRFATRLMARRAQRAIDERGVTMVIFGLIIVALLIVVAIVIDLGNARQQKRQMQNAADAAALAGAGDLGTANAANACADAVSYTYNNLRLGTVQGSCSSGNYSQSVGNQNITVATPYYSGPAAFSPTSLVNVKACQDVATSFARIIGVTSIHVCGNATARKIGITSSGGGSGTTTADPAAPCTVDDFLPNGYFDHQYHLRNNPKNDGTGLNLNNQGMNAVADNNHTGGPPGGVIQEGDWIGATYWSTTPIDFSTNVPTVVFTNTTTGTTTTYTDTNGYGVSATGGPIYIKPMTSINGQSAFTTPPTYVYQIAWRVPSGNPNNNAYSVLLTVYDSASSSNPPNGKCGKGQWTFTKGTVSSGTSSCGENSFIGTISPAPGAVVHPGDTLTVGYQDESPIYNPGDSSGDPNRIQFTVDNTPIPQAPLGTPSTQGPNSQASYYGSTTNYTLKSPTSGTTSEKYSTDIQFKVPASLTSGNHTWFLKAYDSDNNKPGGDCGVATWTLNVAGGASNVELVQ